MDALLKEIEEMETTQEVVEEIKEEKVEEIIEEVVENPVEEVKEEVAEAKDEEAEKLKAAQEAYRERQRAKKEEAAKKAEESARLAQEEAARKEAASKPIETDEAKLLAAKLEQVDQIILEQKMQKWIGAAERELGEIEKEYKVVFPDYDDLVSTAMDITKDRMVQGGMTEQQANEALRLEKLKIADAAAARGEDPAEAVYKEAKAINTWFQTYASKLGYVKQGASQKPITQKAALREASKPNAMTGGKGAAAIKPNYDEMDDVSDLTIGQMLSGNY
jgi:hypothetical protein